MAGSNVFSLNIERFMRGEAPQGWGRRQSIRMTAEQFKSPAVLSRKLPSQPKARVAFILDALETYKMFAGVPELTGGGDNHVIGLLEDVYRKNQDPALAEEGARLAVKMVDESLDKHDMWAGLAALSVIPFKNPETMLKVGRIIVGILNHEMHWPCIMAAAHLALILKDSLPPAVKELVKAAADRSKRWYAGFAEKGDTYSAEAAAIMANLNRITAEF